tara:strand:- start:2099 stop:3235 length:1137 start_codon:yes stop_codon:yes gene_type:complete
MTNQERRQLLDRFRASDMEGSILDVFQAYNQGVDLISQHEASQAKDQPVTLTGPQEQREGLRPYHAAGDLDRSAVFKDVPPNTPFNTSGMKIPINIDKYDEQGHLVESHKSVPPGVRNIPTGPYRGDVIETPAKGYRDGGFVNKKQKGGFIQADVNNNLEWMREDGTDPALGSRDIADYLSTPNPKKPDRSLLDSEQWQAVGDTVAYHESGHHQRMDPRATQRVTDELAGSPTRGQTIDGPGRGMFQFETGPTQRFPKAQESWQTGIQRTVNVLTTKGVPREVINNWRGTVPEDPREASEDLQRMIFLANLTEGAGDTEAYARGDISLGKLWATGHKGKWDQNDLKSFEESKKDAETGLKKYGLKRGGVRYNNRRYKK